MKKQFLFIIALFIFATTWAQTWSVKTTATASDASASSYFGSDVVIDGNYSAVRSNGSMYVFQRDTITGNWNQLQKLIIPGNYSSQTGTVSIWRNYISAIGSDGIYVFKLDSSKNIWSEQQKIATTNDGATFSGAISMYGNYIVAGATAATTDENGSNPLTNAGAVYVFEQISSIWSEQQKIVASDRYINANFGSSLRIYEDNMVIGAIGTASIVGGAYAYKRNNLSDLWALKSKIFTGTPNSMANTTQQNVGCVFINRDYIVIGAFQDFCYKNGLKYYDYNNIKILCYKINSAEIWTQLTNLSICNYYAYLDSDFTKSEAVNISKLDIYNNLIVCNYYAYSHFNKLYNILDNSITLIQSLSTGCSITISGEDIAVGNSAAGTSNTGNVSYYKRDPYSTLANTSLSIGSTQGSTASTSLIYNTPFTATSNQSWLTITPSSITPVNISDTVQLKFTASVNTLTSPRTAKVTIAPTGVSYQYVVVTQKAVPVITWNNPKDIIYGTPLTKIQLNASANIAGTYKYTPSLQDVLNTGVSQQLKVDFEPTDTANYESTSKTVQINVVKATPVLNWQNPSNIAYGTELSNIQLNASSDVVGTYTYNPNEGTLLEVGNNQTLQVNFAPIDPSNYDSVSKIVQINVIKATPIITWSNPSDINYGTKLSTMQLNATADVPGTFIYTPALDSILNAGYFQKLTVEFIPDDKSHYNSKTDSVYINVLQFKPSIKYITDTIFLTYGQKLSINNCIATSDIPGYCKMPYVDSILNAGINEIFNTFIPNDQQNYEYVIYRTYVKVNKALPQINWSNPLDIDYGTTLTFEQLNASSNIEGVFNYYPSLGTILNIGDNQKITCIFIPSDSKNYQTISKDVYLNVKEVSVQDILIFTNTGQNKITTKGGSLQLNVSFTPSNASNKLVTWSISDNTLATISSNGLLTAIKDGIVTVNVASNENSNIIETFQVTIDQFYLSVSSNAVNISSSEGSSTLVAVSSNTNWSAVSNQSWLTISPSSNNGNANITFTATANTGSSRTAIVTISAVGEPIQNITITQPSEIASLTINTNSLILSKENGSTTTVNVYSNTNWIAMTDQSWLSISPNVTTTGNETVIFTSLSNNTGFDRTATITISALGVPSQVITITQKGEIGTPVEEIKNNEIVIYPNPAKDFITIISNFDIENISIYAVNGKIILKKRIEQNQKIDLTSLPQGTYIIKIQTKDGNVEKTLIKY